MPRTPSVTVLRTTGGHGRILKRFSRTNEYEQRKYTKQRPSTSGNTPVDEETFLHPRLSAGLQVGTDTGVSAFERPMEVL